MRRPDQGADSFAVREGQLRPENDLTPLKLGGKVTGLGPGVGKYRVVLRRHAGTTTTTAALAFDVVLAHPSFVQIRCVPRGRVDEPPLLRLGIPDLNPVVVREVLSSDLTEHPISSVPTAGHIGVG